MADRSASIVWEGDINDGRGNVNLDSSGAGSFEVTFPRRIGDEAEGITSPEELIAAAHASCFSMALAGQLGRAGFTPERMETNVVVTVEKTDAGLNISRVAITTRGTVPGADEDAFRQAAEGAKEGCPVSKLIKGNTEITLDAALA
jgi:lipoyl-dependent peroxiredoxin